MIAEIKALVVVTDRFGENFTFNPHCAWENRANVLPNVETTSSRL